MTYLDYWYRKGQVIAFDIETGDGEIVLKENSEGKTTTTGFAANEKRLGGPTEFFAVLKLDNNIVFAAGNLKWVLGTEQLKFQHKRVFPFVSGFSVIVSGKVAYKFTYSHVWRVLLQFIDFTYDEIDRDADFFLEFIAEYANDEEWVQHQLIQLSSEN